MAIFVCVALVTLSMDRFQVSTDQVPATSKRQGSIVELPANYGRPLPLSEEEIETINVREFRVHIKCSVGVMLRSLRKISFQLGGAR